MESRPAGESMREISADGLCPFPLAEALRVVSLRLDIRQVLRARLTVDTAGIAIDATAPDVHYRYTWAELAEHSRGQQALRGTRAGKAPWQEAAALTRWSVLLRMIGMLLDAQAVRTCVIEAAVASPADPSRIETRVTVDGQQVLGADEVQLHYLRLLIRHIEPRETPVQGPVPRPAPRWQLWRRVS